MVTLGAHADLCNDREVNTWLSHCVTQFFCTHADSAQPRIPTYQTLFCTVAREGLGTRLCVCLCVRFLCLTLCHYRQLTWWHRSNNIGFCCWKYNYSSFKSYGTNVAISINQETVKGNKSSAAPKCYLQIVNVRVNSHIDVPHSSCLVVG